jgi:hypothetical protein
MWLCGWHLEGILSWKGLVSHRPAERGRASAEYMRRRRSRTFYLTVKALQKGMDDASGLSLKFLFWTTNLES